MKIGNIGIRDLLNISRNVLNNQFHKMSDGESLKMAANRNCSYFINTKILHYNGDGLLKSYFISIKIIIKCN